MSTRKEMILSCIRPETVGIEIGPSFAPVAPKRDGFRVQSIDCMNREQLIAKYRDQNVDCDRIEDVDFVWNGESYCELTGVRKHYDWIIASNVIEHTTDLVGFLNDCDEVLKDDGVLSLAVPDKRFCFDRFRPLTGLGQVVDRHFEGAKTHTPGTLAEYCLNVVSRGGRITWDEGTQGDFKFSHTLEHAHAMMHAVRGNSQYVDCHAWCFTPHSFRLLIHDLHALGLTAFKETAFFTSQGSEFFVTISRAGNGPQQSRLELLQMIDRELAPPQPKSIGSKITARAIRWAKNGVKKFIRRDRDQRKAA